MSEAGKDLALWILGCLSGLMLVVLVEVVCAWPKDPLVDSGSRRFAFVIAALGGGCFLWWFA